LEEDVPLYEYECLKCRHQFEALVIGARKPVCPKCKSEELEKRVSPLGFAGVGAFGGGGRSSSGCGSSGGGG
jgi:putative FmdB family regulatory protein